MAKSETSFCLYAPVFLALQLFAHAAAGHANGFNYIYAFGDSLTDTGNVLIYVQRNVVGHLPYGETFFHYPTGRASDGRLVVDFLAKRVGAPNFLLPYLGLNNGKINGKEQTLVNFAVGRATAENVDYLNATYYNFSVFVPYSLDKQVQWFSTLPIAKDKEALSKALFYFGEIGVNDYNLGLLNGFSIDDIIIELVPNVIKFIENALEFLIESGAKYLVVEGGFPIGCTPIYRPFFINASINKYGCVEESIKLYEIHDKLLKQLVQNLTSKYNQDVQITFFDQLKAYFEILKHPSPYGFTNTTDPCFDALRFDALSSTITNVTACPIPSTYVSWDGLHYTEATNNVLLDLFYTKEFVTPYPNFLTSKSF